MLFFCLWFIIKLLYMHGKHSFYFWLSSTKWYNFSDLLNTENCTKNQVKHFIKQHTSILSWKEFFQICKLWKFMWILRTCHVITVQLAWIGRSRGRLYNMRTHYSIVFHVSNLYIIILGLTLLYHYIMNQIYIKHCKHTVVFFNS